MIGLTPRNLLRAAGGEGGLPKPKAGPVAPKPEAKADG